MKKTKRIIALVLAFVLTFLQMSEIAWAAESKVTEIKASSDTISAEGGEITLTVRGEGLTNENWGVTVTSYYAGTNTEAGKMTASVKNITASGATVVIPKNTMRNEIEYHVTAGVRSGNSIAKEATLVILQDGKAETVALNPKDVVMTNATTIEVAFTEDVILAKTDISKLKELIFVSDFGNENSNRIEMADNASVSISGKVVKIDFKRTLDLKANSVINIKEGALKTFGGKVLSSFYWMITYTPTVTAISLDRDILDSKGGAITATLKGVQVNQITKEQIQASIFVPEQSSATNISVAITADEINEPVLRFEVPENTTNITKCYYLQVKIDGVPVYEGTVENSAKKAVVSVLPEGVSANEQTLGGATITGNNKLEGVGDNRNITVVVSKQLGELKTVMTLYGTNLDSKLTKVRAIDENGVIWPVYDIPE